MLGISGQEFIVLLVLAAIVLGPERLPQYTQQLAQTVRSLRRMAMGATEQVRAELGPEFDEIDWRKLDPRQYDPRRIVREALSEDFDPQDPLGMKSVHEDVTGAVADTRRQLRTSSVAAVNGAAANPDHSASTVAEPAKAVPVTFDPDTL